MARKPAYTQNGVHPKICVKISINEFYEIELARAQDSSNNLYKISFEAQLIQMTPYLFLHITKRKILP